MTAETTREPDVISKLRGCSWYLYDSARVVRVNPDDILAAYDALARERDELAKWKYDFGHTEGIWEAKCVAAERERDALRGVVDTLQKDKDRLDWLASDPPFDAMGDEDIHETAFEVAAENGREEATLADYCTAMRRVLDAVRALDGEGR